MKLKLLTCLTFVLCSQFAVAQDYVWAPDQNGSVQTLESLSGEKGILLVFNRSFDWCPFCKAQLITLVEKNTDFESLGLSVVITTYDPVGTLLLVTEDEGVKHVNAFGIGNMTYSPSDNGYGISEPGIMIVDPQGVIQHKFASGKTRFV